MAIYSGGPPTRLYNGVGTELPTDPLGMFPLPNAYHIYQYQNDFTTYAAGDWVVTAGGSGSSVALTTGIGGNLLNTVATSGVESITGGLCVNFTNATSSVNGLKTWFAARFMTDATVANPDYQIGLTSACTTFNGNTDGVYFTKATGATQWSFVIRGASTSTTVVIPTTVIPAPVSSTWYKFAYYFDGKGMFWIFYNGVCVGTYGTTPAGAIGSLGSSLANLPLSTVFLGPTFLNGYHTATSTLTVDYVTSACEVAR